MIGTRNKSKSERLQAYKKDLSNIYFSKMEWGEVRVESNEGKKNINPPKRWGHTFSLINGRIFMIGGCVKTSMKSPLALYELNIEKNPKQGEVGTWKKYALAGAENYTSIESHSSEVYQGNIYLFCGHLNDSISEKVFKIDVEKFTMQELRLHDACLKKREAHVSFPIYERYVLLHGGFNGETPNQNNTTKRMGEKHLVSIIDLENRRLIDFNDIQHVGQVPRERESHCRVSHKQGVFIFGGISVLGPSSDSEEQENGSGKKGSTHNDDSNPRAARTKNRRKNLEEDLHRDPKQQGPTNFAKVEPREVEICYPMKVEQSTENTSKPREYQNDSFAESNSRDMMQEERLQNRYSDKEDSGSAGDDASDFLNDIYFLRFRKESDKFILNWERITTLGAAIPKVCSTAGMNLEDNFLIIFGGEGYHPSKLYSEDEGTETLDLVTCIHIESRSVFPLQMGGIRMEPMHACATFSHRGKHYIHGGEFKNRNFSNKLFFLDLEQRVQKDLFGLFSGPIRPLCSQCKHEYELCFNNLDTFLKAPKKHIPKRTDADKIESSIQTKSPVFTIPMEIREDIMQIVDMERMQEDFRSEKFSKSILMQIILMFYSLKQRLFFSSINFEAVSENSIGLVFEGSFNIFEQLDKLEFSILDSIFYYLIATANNCKVDASLFIRTKTKVLMFFYGGHNLNDELLGTPNYPQLYMRFDHYAPEDLPENIKNIKFRKNLILFSGFKETFLREETPYGKDIIIKRDKKDESSSNKIENSFRLYFSLLFKEKTENFKLSILGQTVNHIYLNDILACADLNGPMKVMDRHEAVRAISFLFKCGEPPFKHQLFTEFLGNKIVLHYGPDYLIHFSINKLTFNQTESAEYENTASVAILIENQIKTSI